MRIKLKFRLPEVLLGALLTVAIFATGMTFQSSRHPLPTNGQPTIQATHNPEPFSWDWLTHDGVVFFTCILAAIAVVQAGLFVWQLRYMRKGMTDAAAAATASVAQAKIAGETQRDLQRPYIFVFGVHRLGRDTDGDWFIEYTVANYGSIPAIIEDVFVGFETSEDGEPARPPRASDDHNLLTSPILAGSERRQPFREYIPRQLITGSIMADFPDGTPRSISPEFIEGIDVFFRVVIQYRGPFTRGHETAAMWLVRTGLGDLVPRGDQEYNYNL